MLHKEEWALAKIANKNKLKELVEAAGPIVTIKHSEDGVAPTPTLLDSSKSPHLNSLYADFVLLQNTESKQGGEVTSNQLSV